MATKARIKIPASAAAGEIITVKTLANHRMESGQRVDADGYLIPRHIINHFEARFNDRPVFSVDIDPAISANPYFEFSTRIDEAGTFTLTWTDDAGEITEMTHDISIDN